MSDDVYVYFYLFLLKINDIDNELKIVWFGFGFVKNEVKKIGKLF